ncbi:MAG: alpha/beta hydrolase [Nitriliruptorales bacterium]|nr:alpha/beta hydrolase [Nitriliruptorales bacterium]
MAWTSITTEDAQLEVLEEGSGEPVLLIQTALTADEHRPVATLLDPQRYRTIVTHRRGYAGSSPVEGPGSVARDARDCVEVLASLQVDRTHVVGLSYSGAVALQLAADAPDLVHSLVLIEPPPVHIPSRDDFLAANDRLMRTRREQGVAAAFEEFMTTLVGPDWETDSERRLPGSAEQMRRDATIFFDTDVPALLEWEFSPKEVDSVSCPVLYVGGTDSGPWWVEVRELILDWFPDAEDVIIEGADHSLALTHPEEVAEAISAFLRQHPIQ